MSEFVKIGFGPLAGPEGGTYVVLVGDDLKCTPDVEGHLGESTALIGRAATAAKFKGKALTSLDILAPYGILADRLLVVGVGAAAAAAETSWSALGGFVFGKLGGAPKATIAFSPPHGAGALGNAAAAADFMLGMRLRAFRFDLYKTKKKDDDAPEPPDIVIGVAEVAAARKAAKSREAIATGVELARGLINEPPNVLFPEEFAERAAKLSRVGVEIDIFDEKRMAKLGMGSLLGVGQGSPRDSRMVVMRWNGAKDPKAAPVAFIGKGVCFDTGGISIKSAAGMEDMKGDMAGAACVVGLMHALASRKAKVNAIGAIGLVENMPDGNAIRPGDILTSMSGQTIEIINTDAEGRLVLADVLWYIQDKYKPVFMVDLATLTGAILVALGHEYAGLFSNNDELSARLLEAGKTTGEKVWRMPMDPAFDKMIDSKFADVKNAGGRHGGSSSAAHFLRRFVNDTPWAHLDIAGVGMGSPASETNQGWASGWGVALLDRLVADHYEQ